MTFSVRYLLMASIKKEVTACITYTPDYIQPSDRIPKGDERVTGEEWENRGRVAPVLSAHITSLLSVIAHGGVDRLNMTEGWKTLGKMASNLETWYLDELPVNR